MPMLRRSYKKKIYRKRKSNKRRSGAVPTRLIKPKSSFTNAKIHWYKHSTSGGSVESILTNTITQTTAIQNFSWVFNISDLPNAINYRTIYEQYRIFKIVVKLIPMATQVVQHSVSTGGGVNCGILASVIDWSKSTPLEYLSDYEQYQNFKFQGVFSRRIHTRIWKPSILENAVSHLDTGIVISKNKWLSWDNRETTHFGIKVYLDAAPDATVAQSFWVQVKYYVGFKNVK